MKAFLQQVAEAYIQYERQALPDYCFVFPNKRSATFFTHYIQQGLQMSGGGVMPQITNITDFVGSFSELTEANRYDQLFTLFDEYRKLPDVDVDFDRFAFWGEMLLADFNDVDRYLVDADALFVNIKRLREISANYLTPEQREVIRRYWGEDRGSDNIDRFWNHIDKNEKSHSQHKFVKLWSVLQPLYHSYRGRLQEKGLATPGMLYRNACDKLSPTSDFQLECSRYIFVGFNVLSTSEIRIFNRLRVMGRADFYWDMNSPAFKVEDSRATRFMLRNIREFPSRYKLEEAPIEKMPNIRILGVPSNIGQVKTAGEQLQQWLKENVIGNAQNAIDTAVILPDESLFIPMIHSVPESFGTINVTMGFPMRLSPMSALIRNIVSLQLRSRMRGDDKIYFYEDVKTLLLTPALRAIDAEGCCRLETEIRDKRMFTISASLISELAPKLNPIFAVIADGSDRIQVYQYIIQLCDFLNSAIYAKDDMQTHFVKSYKEAADELFGAAERFDISMDNSSFFRLVERAVNADTVNFVGEPLSGLQIMGVLETRALDFKNIIMMSMNERVFPQRHYSRSFIPDALRYGYGMATIDFQESIFAYYFYRLISRAENVTLIYDARSVGGSKSSEMSRYLSQLLYLFGDQGVSHKLRVYSAQCFKDSPISIVKDQRVLKALDRFREGGDKNLSASAINKYINCPLDFYLQYVEGYNVENEVVDYIDASTYGTIIHCVAQRIYESFQAAKDKPVEVTESMLKPYVEENSIKLERLITEEINDKFNRLTGDKSLTPLLGESLILGKVIHATLRSMLKVDMALCPFTFVAAEKDEKMTLKINDDLTVRLRMLIDRIDRVNGCLRFVDYKTGVDPLSSKTVKELFDTDAKGRAKAIMQLLMYCHLYNKHNGSDDAIQPIIYKLCDIASKGIVEPLCIDKNPIFDYHCVNDEFVEALNAKIAEIFDPKVEFTQTDIEENCKYCNFKAICGRENND